MHRSIRYVGDEDVLCLLSTFTQAATSDTTYFITHIITCFIVHLIIQSITHMMTIISCIITYPITHLIIAISHIITYPITHMIIYTVSFNICVSHTRHGMHSTG
jgi:hypothetical protein